MKYQALTICLAFFILFTSCYREIVDESVLSTSSIDSAELERCVYDYFESQTEEKKKTLTDRDRCLDISAEWLQEFKSGVCRELPYKFSLVESTNVDNLIIDQKRSDEFKSVTHFFLEAIPTDGPGERLLLDPTYLQFFNSVPRDLVQKPIFVGEYEQMQTLRREYSELVRWANTYDVEDENAGLYDSRQLFELHYSRGSFSKGKRVFP